MFFRHRARSVVALSLFHAGSVWRRHIAHLSSLAIRAALIVVPAMCVGTCQSPGASLSWKPSPLLRQEFWFCKKDSNSARGQAAKFALPDCGSSPARLAEDSTEEGPLCYVWHAVAAQKGVRAQARTSSLRLELPGLVETPSTRHAAGHRVARSPAALAAPKRASTVRRGRGNSRLNFRGAPDENGRDERSSVKKGRTEGSGPLG